MQDMIISGFSKFCDIWNDSFLYDMHLHVSKNTKFHLWHVGKNKSAEVERPFAEDQSRPLQRVISEQIWWPTKPLKLADFYLYVDKHVIFFGGLPVFETHKKWVTKFGCPRKLTWQWKIHHEWRCIFYCMYWKWGFSNVIFQGYTFNSLLPNSFRFPVVKKNRPHVRQFLQRFNGGRENGEVTGTSPSCWNCPDALDWIHGLASEIPSKKQKWCNFFFWKKIKKFPVWPGFWNGLYYIL